MEYRESDTIELKREVTADIKKEIVAFANASGGSVVVGVEDDGRIAGLESVDQEMQKIANMVRDNIRPDLTMQVRYTPVVESDKEILKVDVNEGSQKPYYLAAKGMRPEGVYVRQGTSSAPVSMKGIREMIVDADGLTFETMRSLEQNLTFKHFDSYLEENNIPSSEQTYMNLGLIQKKTGEYTNLALLLSDQNPYQTKAAVFENKTLQTFHSRKIFTGSVVKQAHELFEYVQNFNDLKSEISGLKRTDIEKWPPEAVREAILNAVIHRDYARNADNQVKIDREEVAFISIGGLPSGISDVDLDKGLSYPRNAKLSMVFYRLGYVEAFGTGLKRIAAAYGNQKLKPVIETTENAFYLTLPSRYLTGPATQKISSLGLPMQEQLRNYMKGKESVTRKEVQDKLQIPRSSAVNLLNDALQAGIVQKTGQGRNTRYQLK